MFHFFIIIHFIIHKIPVSRHSALIHFPDTDQKSKEEAEEFGDIFFYDLPDSYRNMPTKVSISNEFWSAAMNSVLPSTYAV